VILGDPAGLAEGEGLPWYRTKKEKVAHSHHTLAISALIAVATLGVVCGSSCGIRHLTHEERMRANTHQHHKSISGRSGS
jgi:hypothetical protein